MSRRFEHEPYEYLVDISGNDTDCTPGCGACCTVPEIKTDNGDIFKKAGEVCSHLIHGLCSIWNTENQPRECKKFTCRSCSPHMRQKLIKHNTKKK